MEETIVTKGYFLKRQQPLIKKAKSVLKKKKKKTYIPLIRNSEDRSYIYILNDSFYRNI